jgi:hypothetical protein
MTRNPNVDRALGELWLISEVLTTDLRGDFETARRKAAEWEPRPMPKGWGRAQLERRM